MLSVHEPTWDKELKKHTCCGSLHSYHKSSCPSKNSSIPGRTSDPDFIRVQQLKAEKPGITSGQVAKELRMPLAQVNDLWIV